MGLEDVEARDPALDRRRAAAEADIGLIDARRRTGVEHDAGPVASRGNIGLVAVGVERAAGTEPVVREAREDHPAAGQAFGIEPRRAAAEFDPRADEFHDDARIDREAASVAGAVLARDPHVPARPAVDHEIFGRDIDDVGALEPRGHGEPRESLARIRLDADEDAVDRVVREAIPTQFRSDASVGIVERVGVGRDRGAGALGDRVERDRRTGALELDRRERLELGIDHDLAAAEAELGVRDGVDERAPRGDVGILAQDDAAPLATGRHGPDAVAVTAHRVVVVRREPHLPAGRAEHLERGSRARRGGGERGTAHVDHGAAELEDGALVDHGRDPRRHVERRPVGERRS